MSRGADGKDELNSTQLNCLPLSHECPERLGRGQTCAPKAGGVAAFARPQLFGRNTPAGVVSIITQQPEYEFGYVGELTIGNNNTHIARASVTGPINSTMALRLDGSMHQSDGYIDVVDGRDANNRSRHTFRGPGSSSPCSVFWSSCSRARREACEGTRGASTRRRKDRGRTVQCTLRARLSRISQSSGSRCLNLTVSRFSSQLDKW